MRVPVLSEQIHEVDPRVSTDSKFLTKTDFLVKFLAVIAREIVTQPSNPSGTFATRIPIPKTIQVNIGYPIENKASKKKIIPKMIAIIVIIITNLSNSLRRGVLVFFSPDDKSAILPKVVLSPIAITTPFPYPSLHKVPKKAILVVSR